MKVKFYLEIFAQQRTVEMDFDEDDTPEMIEEAMNDWVDSQVDRWYEIKDE